MKLLLVGMISGQIISIIFSSHIFFLLIFYDRFSYIRNNISKINRSYLIMISIGMFFFWNLLSVIYVYISYFTYENYEFLGFRIIIIIIIIFIVFSISYIFVRKFLLHILFETVVILFVFGVLAPFMIKRIEFG
ncbi:MAG: hypothetical protein CL780_01435 [Chloroflexi bacterium]|nr:hypothetical protein [Chloroflexota bacterium]